MSDHDTPTTGADISRRGFLKGVGAGAVATGLLSTGANTPEAEAKSTTALQGPGEVEITLNINGSEQTLSAEPRVTLLDAMRNRIDVTGAKKVCDRGTCGACTVLFDGELAYACSILAIEAEGHEITTPEGLGTPEQMSRVQELFVEHDALQCGFCTPGFVLATTDFVKKHPNASIEEVRAGLGGNLCRCGTYKGIMEVALEASRKGGA